MKYTAILTLMVAVGAMVYGDDASAEPVALAADSQTQISDAVGRAGMAAVYLEATDERPAVALAAGGANFPHAKPGAKTPEERGEKVFYSDVELILLRGESAVQSPALQMTRSVAYAAFVPTDKGMLIAGGCNAEGHTSKVSRIDWAGNELRVEALPELPRTLAYPAFAVLDHKVYVIGGQERADSTVCLSTCYVLDLNDINAEWREMAPMPDGRMLAAAGVVDGLIYVMGGCSLRPNERGEAERTYADDVYCYDPGSNTWAKVDTCMPETLVGMANPLPVIAGKLYVIGGDPGHYYRASLAGQAPSEHPGQSKMVYSYTPADGEWRREGELPVGVATFPAVTLPGGGFITISGETHPGVRTPLIIYFNAQ